MSLEDGAESGAARRFTATTDFIHPESGEAYTGIGSRKTPDSVLEVMEALAIGLARAGWILRSGGADGADAAFEKGADRGNPNSRTERVPFHKQIFLPWRNFNGNRSGLFTVMPAAVDLARSIHPAWDKLSQGAKKLHARNAHQVLGPSLKAPSRFVVAYTEGGRDVGGTRTALVLARTQGIPVFNLGNAKDLEFIEEVSRRLDCESFIHHPGLKCK